jgi:small basic protein (TIGR04137 family)
VVPLSQAGRAFIIFLSPRVLRRRVGQPRVIEEDSRMSIDKSLRRKDQLQRARNVLTRGERIKRLTDEERWRDGQSPYGLPKVKVVKLVVKKAKKAKDEEKVEGEGEAAVAAAPAAEKKATDKKAAEKK